MPLTRRILLSVVAASAAVGTGTAAHAAAPNPESDRAIGQPDARTTVEEWFSLTCTHCARFAQETFPKIQKELIDTGKIRWVFRDFPLDQVALTASMVAHYLPPDRYEPFIMALFASQDRWAFARGVNTTDELWKMAALAGMSKPTFDKAIHDTKLRDWILKQQNMAQKRWGVNSTPSFIINGQKYAGEMDYSSFRKLIPGA